MSKAISKPVKVPDINTPEGVEELERKLKGVDLGPVEIRDTYINAPTDLDAAIERIMELEMRLEDLARAAEIVEITRQFELFEGFRKAAEQALVNKIVIDRPVPEEKMKITIITDEKEKA